MATFFSPGVYIEEKVSNVGTVEIASPSSMGIVGFTRKGPAHRAVLCQSYEQFVRRFGGPVKESFLPYSVDGFFKNGGERVYVVRVPPADARTAEVAIRALVLEQRIALGDGVTTEFSADAETTPLKVNDGATPLVSGTLVLEWRGAGTDRTSTAANLMDRAGEADLIGDGDVKVFEGRIAPGDLPALVPGLPSVLPGTVELIWDDGEERTVVIPAPDQGFISTVENALGRFIVDHYTGRVAMEIAGTAPVAAAPIQAKYVAASAVRRASDDGAGGLIGDVAVGTVDTGTGEFSFTVNEAVPEGTPIIASYTHLAWQGKAASPGAWAHDVRIVIIGDSESYDVATASFGAYSVQVQERNSDGDWEVVETLDEVVFNDPDSASFFPDMMNELSELVTIAEPGEPVAPAGLNGTVRKLVLGGGGDDTLAGRTFQTVLDGPVAARSVLITYTAPDGTERTIKDNGRGSLVGSVDPAGANKIDYTTGSLDVVLEEAGASAATFVTVSFAVAPAARTVVEQIGDAVKGYAEGSDGTFGPSTYGRSQVSASALLQADGKGLYALDKVDAILNVTIPDFTGDLAVTGDLLDYAEARSTQASGPDRFIILGVPKGSTAEDAADWVKYDLGRFSDFAAVYGPWVRIADPLSNNRPLVMPPQAHIAGVYARTDKVRNVGKAPAGTVDGALRGILGLESVWSRQDRDLAYPARVNPLVSETRTGLAVWGARTLSNRQAWRYVNVRRLFMFIERVVYDSTHWVVFEPNGPGLWLQLKTQLDGILGGFFNDGYFAGTSPSQAYFVIVDSSNNTPASIADGHLIVDVGIAPSKPAEFVRFRFHQKTLS